MTNQIIKIEEAKELAGELSTAESLPTALKKKSADILATILAGSELGLQPMQALRSIHLIEGRPTLAANAIAALVRKSGVCEYLRTVNSTNDVCTIETKRKGDPEPESRSYTIKDAQLAGLLDRPNWKRHPKSMLYARCVSQLCRAVFPDVILGVYETDESDEIIEEVSGQLLQDAKQQPKPVQLATSATLEPKPTPKVVDVELRQAPIVPQASKVELPPETTTALASVGFEEQKPYVIQSGKNKGKTFREVDSDALKLAFEFFNAKVSTAKTDKESQSAAAILAQVEREIARRESEQTNAGA